MFILSMSLISKAFAPDNMGRPRASEDLKLNAPVLPSD
jgi:hypothetical protein